MKFRALILIMIVCLALVTGGIVAQDGSTDDCPVNVHSAFERADQVCFGIARNQVCYGNNTVSAVPFPDVSSFEFSAPGDLAQVVHIRSLSLSAMDPADDSWGIAEMRLLLNLSPTEPTDVTLLMFGDVEVDNAAENRTPLPATVNTSQYINVRRYPSTQSGVVATLGPGDEVTAIGRLEDHAWVRVELPQGGVGWLFASLVDIDGDANDLIVEEPGAPYYGPMQAFYYTSGANASCAAVPADGLLIQTPEGVVRVTFLINEVSIELAPSGATAFLEADESGSMSVNMLQGTGWITANGVQRTAIAGTQTRIRLNADRSPSGAPDMPQPYDAERMGSVPLMGLGRTVRAAEAATMDAIQQSNQTGTDTSTTGTAPGDGSTTPGDSNGDTPTDGGTTGAPPDGGRPDCPGGSCEAPGQNKDDTDGDDCPGGSCDAPGQEGSCPGKSCEAPGQNKDWPYLIWFT